MRMTALRNTLRERRGFTLIELLVVIGILAVLLAIVLVAINPARQFAQANDTQRRSDVNSILNAIHQYAAANAGQLPAGIVTGSVIQLSSTGLGASSAAFCDALVTEYLAALPADPLLASGPVDEADCVGTWDTGYTASRSATDNRVTVAAPSAESGNVITVTR